MAAADVTVTQDGVQRNVRLHPYLLTLIRWCVSCIWSAGAVVLHRLMITPLPSIAGNPRPRYKPRPAGRDHLHPEPLVECVVLHEPAKIDMDVIFIHGLYGSLPNTWRQGEWRSKYKSGPVKVPLRRSESKSKSNESNNVKNDVEEMKNDVYNVSIENKLNYAEREVFLEDNTKIDENNYIACNMCDSKTNISINIENKRNYEKTKVFSEEKAIFPNKFNGTNRVMYSPIKSDTKNKENRCYRDTETILDTEENTFPDLERKMNDHVRTVLADEGIYVDKDFYKKVLLNQVEIIDNYKSQAEFVRDLFECENNRYCDDGNIKDGNEFNCQNNKYEVKQHQCVCKVDDKKNCDVGCGCICDECYSPCWPRDWIKADYPNARVISINYTSDPHLWRPLWIKGSKRLRLHERAEQMMQQLLSLGVGQKPIVWVGHSKGGLFIKQIYCEGYEAYLKVNESRKKNLIHYTENQMETANNKKKKQNISGIKVENGPKHTVDNCDIDVNENIELVVKNINNVNEELNNNNSFNSETNIETEITEGYTSIKNEDVKNSTITVDISNDLRSRSTLWANSAGFMFYSVPHRGSPLADFKTPITARSIELMEICKDCSLVMSLQERWMQATRHRPRTPVRSLVETCRTLMSVLWLRIVSVDSADAGIGPLHGVSLDHREICKPSSRRCLLYTELMELITSALKTRSVNE